MNHPVHFNNIELTFFKAHCGGSYTSNRGSLHSPGWPTHYPNNADCIWEIQVPNGNFIIMTIKHFSTEWEENCEFDYLEIMYVYFNLQ